MRRLKGRSLAELAGRGGQSLRILMERAGLAPGPVLPDSLKLEPSLPFPTLEPVALEAIYAARPLERALLIEHADAALNGRFHLLGFRDLDFGTPVDWHLDPVRQRRAPRPHWSQVPYLDESVVGDHKVTWELNRNQWLVTLAQAARLTGDPRYPAAIVVALKSWLDANPARQGINWASSLEMALRAIAWTWTLHLAGQSLPDGANLAPRLLGAIDLHGRQVERFLSTWFSPNTHLTGEALGLLYLGVAWPGLRRASAWRTMGWQILVDQLPRQVRPDGTYFEQATWYQGYTVDFYLHALMLARHAGLAIPPGFESRLQAAVDVLDAVRREDGSLPLLGDDDGGRLLPLYPDRTRFLDSSCLAAAVLRRPGTCKTGLVPAATAWIVGPERWRQLDSAPAEGHQAGSRGFPDGGCYRLGGTEGAMLVDAGPHGALAGGHSHADALGLDLTMAGRPIIVDPGTGAYVGPWRDRFRQTAAHNTVSLADGSGSATPAGLFRWGQWPETVVRHWSAGADWAALVAEHDGFPGLCHQRAVLFREGWGWLVVDSLTGRPEGAASRVRFQFAVGLQASIDGRHVRIGDGRDTVAWLSTDVAGTLRSDSGLVSSCYGVAEEAPALVRELSAADGLAGAATLLSGAEGATIERLPSEGRAWEWRTERGVARVSGGPDQVYSWESAGFSLRLG